MNCDKHKLAAHVQPIKFAAVFAGLVLAFSSSANHCAATDISAAGEPAKQQISVPTEGASAASSLTQQDDESSSTAGAGEDAASRAYADKCAGCHTIGRGKLVGPDLAEVVNWKEDEVQSNVKRMEQFSGPLSDDLVKELVKLLRDPKAPERLKAQEERKAAVEVSREPASLEVGQRLFSGHERFANGGMACIACHQVKGQGGTMGKDLTDAYAKLGESALLSALEEPAYPVMRAIYREHKLTRQEALHVAKYLGSLQQGQEQGKEPPVAQLGLLGAVVLLCALGFFYRNRNRGVHARLSRRGH